MMQLQRENLARKFIKKKNTIEVNNLYKTSRIVEDETPLHREVLGLQKCALKPPHQRTDP